LLTAYVRFRNALAWHAFECANALHRSGHNVFLYCQKDSPLARWTEGAPFRVNREFNFNQFGPRNTWGGMRSLWHTLQEFSPDILNPHCPPGHSFLAIARTLAGHKVPLIRTVADPRGPKSHWANRRLHLDQTDGMIFTCSAARNRYAAVFNLSGKPCQTILPGFRADDFVRDTHGDNFRRNLGVKEGQLLAGIIARMSPEKGQEILFQALALMPKSDRVRIFCVLAGESSRERNREELEQYCAALGMRENAAFMDFLDDVRPLMSELDLGIITSTRSEAICRVALEYMSYGIPVISSDVNILPEVVRNGQNGWIFPNQDASRLAQCLTEAVHNHDERRKRGAAGRQMVRDEFHITREINDTLAFYQAVADTCGRKRR
jgi:glycosyltransferase involved in cell wall biosynthesis